MDPLLSTALQYLRDAGIVGLLLIGLIGGYRKWWVWGWLYADIYADRERIRVERDKARDESAEWRAHALARQEVWQRERELHQGKDGC